MGALKLAAATLLVGWRAAADRLRRARVHRPWARPRRGGRRGRHRARRLAGGGQNGGTLEYCQVPRGRRACAVRRSIGVPNDGFGKVQVLLPRPGTIQILAPLLRDSVLASSFDAGNTFGTAPIGPSSAFETALYGPGDFISIMSARARLVRALQPRRQRPVESADAVRLRHGEPRDDARPVGRGLRRLLLGPACALGALERHGRSEPAGALGRGPAARGRPTSRVPSAGRAAPGSPT